MATRSRKLLNLAVVIVLVKCFIHCLSSTAIDNARLYGYSYRNISVSGIQLCAKECLTESWCKSFNFHRNYLLCELNYESFELEYIIYHEDYVYSNASYWAPIIVDACSDQSCGVNEKCIVLKSNTCICSQIAFCMDPSYTLENRSNLCYKVVDFPRLDWYAADDYCHSENGRLISLDTREKAEAIGDHIFDQYNSTSFNGWIGLTDVEEEGSFVWVNGNNLIHEFWNKGQPNDYYIGCPNFTMEEEGDFGVMNKYGLWHDASFCMDPSYTLENRSNLCYKVVDFPRLDWYAADDYCHSENGRLISLDTREKAEAIGDHIFDQYNSTSFNGWIGLTDVEEEGSFVWVNGNNLIHEFWNKGQPNDYYIGCPNFTMEEEGDFGVMNKYGLWHDACWLKELKFICETKVNYIIN